MPIKKKFRITSSGAGFHEIFTNSITNAAYFEEADHSNAVRLLNNLSAVHNIMRPSMLETGLEAVAYNLNRKNSDIRFFEFGKTYHSLQKGIYAEKNRLCLYVSGNVSPDSWKGKAQPADVYFLKGVVERILALAGATDFSWLSTEDAKFEYALQVTWKGQPIGTAGAVKGRDLNRFDIKQPVLFADFDWTRVDALVANQSIQLTELPKQLPVYRDLAIVVPRSLPYASVEKAVQKLKMERLKDVKLFDIFESEKLGADKKSMAISMTFLDEEKTLTDTEIDSMMQSLMSTLKTDLHAEIRK